MLFPVTNRNLVLLGKECGIASKSWFWHFTVWEKHRHLSGQPWQCNTTASMNNRCIIAELRALPRTSPLIHPPRRRSLVSTNLWAQTLRNPTDNPKASRCRVAVPRRTSQSFSNKVFLSSIYHLQLKLHRATPQITLFGTSTHFHEDKMVDEARKCYFCKPQGY